MFLFKAKKVAQEHQPWQLSYQKAAEARPSWSKHGMPTLFKEFISLVKKGSLKEGIHLDIGCGNGVKTVNFALAGFETVGIDISDDGFKEAKELIKELKLTSRCKVLKANCLDLPLEASSVRSASDTLCFTHLKPNDQKKYLEELKRVTQPGSYILMTLFSDKDEHFHGHKVSKYYTFKYDPKNLLMDGYAHYHGMVNYHFNEGEIKKTFNQFKIIKMLEVKHPLYSHRFLWNVILQGFPDDAKS